MPHAKVNLRAVTDAAAEHGLSDHQEARFPRQQLALEQTGVNHLIVKPGRREAFAHKHGRVEEVIVVLAGSGCVKLDDALVELERFDVVRVDPGTTRRLEAGDDGLEVLVVGPLGEDAEIVADFWD